MRVRFHPTKETWKLRFSTQSDTFCVTASGLLFSRSSFLFRDDEFMASPWNNWQSWKKFSFVSSAFYTPPVRRAGVPRLDATKSRKRECTPAHVIQRCHKVPLKQRSICTLAPFTVVHLAYLVVLQNLVGALVRPHGRMRLHSGYPASILFLFLHFLAQ